ncbi:TPA: ISL3 family transposase [Enterococcus faecium]|nr:hypothetical protein Z971_15550 [Enterococcus faecium VRE0576]HAQ3887919.1 ISL3 family transposase [Enterococcus faecium]HAR1781458.1 ISL3 family transposase [Enterococcus faecium]HBC2649019.1 ISL3 family transposase [Enterococcus faecium]HBC2770161.1 ISL3 family transposase [Enterococcus faecium]
MSYTQLIKDTLEILDLTVTFEKNCLTKEKYKGASCMIYRGKLSYAPRSCTHCTEKNTMIRWGKTTVRLLVHDVSEYKTYLDLEKQRFRCKHCGKTVVADTSVVDKHCFIRRKVRWSVVARLQKNTSMTEIAHQKKISTSSVYRILKKILPANDPV